MITALLAAFLDLLTRAAIMLQPVTNAPPAPRQPASEALPSLPYRPFIDPLNLQSKWFLLLIPLALLISAAYKAVRVRDLKDYPIAVLRMTVQIIVAVILLGAASFVFVEILIPYLAPMPE